MNGRLGNEVVSVKTVESFQIKLDNYMDGDDRWK